eukprot:7098038-Pyramimonas_sp.AAC.1
MAKKGICEDVGKFNSCDEPYKCYKGDSSGAARAGREYLDDLMSENPDTFLIHVVRQSPPTSDG